MQSPKPKTQPKQEKKEQSQATEAVAATPSPPIKKEKKKSATDKLMDSWLVPRVVAQGYADKLLALAKSLTDDEEEQLAGLRRAAKMIVNKRDGVKHAKKD